jgi:integrase
MLSDLFIRSVAPPQKGVKRYADKNGLYLQVSQGGTKTFYLLHGPAARRLYLKLGRYGPPPNLSLAKAREQVRTIIAKKTLGIEDETSATTVQQAIDRFLAKHCDQKNKPRTAAETRRLLAYLEPLAKRRLVKVDTPAVIDIVDNASKSLAERRHVFATARTFLNWCCRESLIKSSPLQHLKAPGLVVSRDRMLTDKEMGRIYKAASELGHPYGFICLIAIHTGMRRGEVGGLEWSFITPETITLPPKLTKNNREHVLPNLIEENLGLIPRKLEPVIDSDGNHGEQICKYLFPSSVNTPYSTWSDGKEALDRLARVENFVFHDFRRYLSTTMAKLRVPIDVTEAILNHLTGSRSPIQRVYDRHDRLPEMREALHLYENHLAQIVAAA